MRHRPAIVRTFFALLVASLPFPAEAQLPGSDLIGDWTHVRLTEPADSAPGCRYFKIETREYQLAPGWNGEVHGTYQRRTRPVWAQPPIAGPGQCPMRNGNLELPPWRNDFWSVQGTRGADGSLHLRAIWSQCGGPGCSDGTEVAEQFETILTTRPGGALDAGSGSGDGQLPFTASAEVRADEQAAAASVPELLRPLREGDCSRFYADSLDPSLSRTLPQDSFCEIYREIGRLLATAHEGTSPDPARISLGIARGIAPVALVDGDVLVMRYFVVGAAGELYIFVAMLHRQGDGSWRFLRVPPF